MRSAKFTSPKTARTFVITIIDDGEEIEVTEDDKVVGTMSLEPRETINREPTYYITDLSLERCRSQGVGRACLKFHIEEFETKLTAAHEEDGHVTGISRDSSYLVGDGPYFIEQMRKEGIVSR